MSYKDLGFDGFGIRTIPTYTKQTPQETRASAQPGAVVADKLYVGSEDNVVKADKEGLYVGNRDFVSAPFNVDMQGNAKLSSAEITVKPATSQSALRVTKADGEQLLDVDTTNGWVNIGPDQPPYNQDPQCSLYIVKTIDGYHSTNLINLSNGEFASADIGAVNNNPDGLGGFVDLGINGMGWNDPSYAVFDASAGYVFCADNNFYVGAGGSNLYFFVGGFDSKSYIKASINSDGVFFPFSAPTVSAPTYVEGGIYYDTTAHKLMVGGAAGWETVTSTA